MSMFNSNPGMVGSLGSTQGHPEAAHRGTHLQFAFAVTRRPVGGHQTSVRTPQRPTGHSGRDWGERAGSAALAVTREIDVHLHSLDDLCASTTQCHVHLILWKVPGGGQRS